MSKRFTDTEKWKDPWFEELEPKGKLFFFYYLDNCDHAGIWKGSFKHATYCIGLKYTKSDMFKDFGDRIVELSNGSFFMERFITFQYKMPLVMTNNAHKGVINSLKYNNIQFSSYIDPNKTLPSPSLGAQDKDKDKAINIKKTCFAPDNLINEWNEICVPKSFPHAKALSRIDVNNIIESQTMLETVDEWRDYFSKIKNDPYILENLRIGINHFLKPEIVSKILNSPDGSSTTIEKKFAEMVAENPGPKCLSETPLGKTILRNAVKKMSKEELAYKQQTV